MESSEALAAGGTTSLRNGENKGRVLVMAAFHPGAFLQFSLTSLPFLLCFPALLYDGSGFGPDGGIFIFHRFKHRID
jgi:hypothetical protein